MDRHCLRLQGSGSNIDICVITKDKVDYIRPYEVHNVRSPRQNVYDYKPGTTGRIWAAIDLTRSLAGSWEALVILLACRSPTCPHSTAVLTEKVEKLLEVSEAETPQPMVVE
jgi:hypothetical protein